MFAVNIVFIGLMFWEGNDFWTNVGFLVLGMLLSVATTVLSEARERVRQTADLARILYAELAHLVARCCFDSEGPWKKYWPEGASPGLMNTIKLKKFTPVVPTIYVATAGQLALLPGSASQALIEFQYRLSALRREIENIANDADSSTRMEDISIGALRLVGLRMCQTLGPGLKALEALQPLVGDWHEIEARARAGYYETRTSDNDPRKTLKKRIEILLAT